MSQSRLAYLFHRYVNKEHTPAEKAELFSLIESEDIDEELKTLLGKMIEGSEAEMHLREDAGDKILRAIVGDIHQPSVAEIPLSGKSVIPAWLKIAAAAVVFIGLISYFFVRPGKNDGANDQPAVATAAAGSLLHVSTTTGEGKKIKLPDGTQVWLSPSSIIEYPASFSGKSLREINLSGEGFFEVAHDPVHPFIIHSGNIETRVVGTSFNIQAYDNQEEINVMVVTGKVNVTNRAKVENVELVANQRAVFYRNTTTLVKEETDAVAAPVLLKRKNGEFVYRAERLQKVIDDLQEYFGVKIQAAAAIKECPVTFNFYLSSKIEEILEPIALSLNGSVQKKQEDFFIDGKACPGKDK
jgi:hypothetical protein